MHWMTLQWGCLQPSLTSAWTFRCHRLHFSAPSPEQEVRGGGRAGADVGGEAIFPNVAAVSPHCRLTVMVTYALVCRNNLKTAQPTKETWPGEGTAGKNSTSDSKCHNRSQLWVMMMLMRVDTSSKWTVTCLGGHSCQSQTGEIGICWSLPFTSDCKHAQSVI